VLCFFLLAVSAETMAQKPRYSHEFYTNLSNLVFTQAYNISYSYITKKGKMPMLTVFYFHDNAVLSFKTRLQGWQATFDYRIVTMEKGNVRYYVSPYLKYQHLNFAMDNGLAYLQQQPGVGVVFGQTFMPRWKLPLLIDWYVGVNYVPLYLEEITSIPNQEFYPLPQTLYGLGPRIGLLLGYGL
jgi:hypothetical protein